MGERPAFLTDYIAAYLAANPERPEPTFDGPDRGGWYRLSTGRPPSYVTKVRKGALITMAERLRARAEPAP